MIRILPREEKFSELFNQQATVLHEAARVLLDMMEGPCAEIAERANQIKALEHRGDTMTHDIITRLNRTFITPLDREDIHELSSRMDDVIDLIDATASRMMLFKITERRPAGIELARIIKRAAAEIVAAVPHITGERDKILEHCQELNRLEHEADTVCRTAIAQLFEEERDPITLIKWKEIFEVLEAAVDKAEDVSDVLETIVLKSA
jgi:predicted phosphate transport protein (TIGR00153 family)